MSADVNPPAPDTHIPPVQVNAPTNVYPGADGNMGMGAWAKAGQMTFAALVATLFAWLIAYEMPRQQRENLKLATDAHKETIERMERIVEIERRAAQTRDEWHIRVIERNTTAVERMADEMKALRTLREAKDK